MYHILFGHSSIELYLGFFQSLAIMHKAALNICIQEFMWTLVSNQMSKYLEA